MSCFLFLLHVLKLYIAVITPLRYVTTKLTRDHDTVTSVPEAQLPQNCPLLRKKAYYEKEGGAIGARGCETNGVR